jgi:putative pyruvate formate lyase activating enzyme
MDRTRSYNERDPFSIYRSCALCPRRCKVDRTAGQKGFCGESDRLRAAAIEAHMGEEPPISGRNGSGTVFFSGCSLRCAFCQNFQISHDGLGSQWDVDAAVNRLLTLHRERDIHNVNFVTPDHFFPHTIAIVERMKARELDIPVLYNLSGYQRIESLRMIVPYADIYLPDFKYSDASLAQRLSRCPDYPAVALDAIAEMVRQKGFLDSFAGCYDDGALSCHSGNTSPIAIKGVLVRHLILPGHVKNSVDALTMLFLEFGRELPLSLMSQYTPVRAFPEDPALNRPITQEEFQSVFNHALELGFRNLFVQYPEDLAGGSRPFVPDFSKDRPFTGNVEGESLRPPAS